MGFVTRSNNDACLYFFCATLLAKLQHLHSLNVAFDLRRRVTCVGTTEFALCLSCNSHQRHFVKRTSRLHLSDRQTNLHKFRILLPIGLDELSIQLSAMVGLGVGLF